MDKAAVGILTPVMSSLIPNCSKGELKSATKVITKAYSKKHVGKQESSSIDYESDARRCSYLYLYGTRHIQMVFQYLKALQTKWTGFEDWYRSTVKSLMRIPGRSQTDRPLHVSALGGGPGLELVCVYLWLEQLMTKDGRSAFDVVDCTVCDVNTAWEPLFGQLLANGFREGVLKKNGKIRDIKANYVESDLLRPSLDAETERAIRNSDIVMMVKFLSAVSKQEENCRRMFRNVLRAMKPRAILIVIDGNSKASKDVIREAVDAEPTVGTIFKHELIKPSSQKKHFSWTKTYRKHFSQQPPLTGVHTKTFAVGLLKCDSASQANAYSNIPSGIGGASHSRETNSFQCSSSENLLAWDPFFEYSTLINGGGSLGAGLGPLIDDEPYEDILEDDMESDAESKREFRVRKLCSQQRIRRRQTRGRGRRRKPKSLFPK